MAIATLPKVFYTDFCKMFKKFETSHLGAEMTNIKIMYL